MVEAWVGRRVVGDEDGVCGAGTGGVSASPARETRSAGFVHFTPTYSSRINQVERWFAYITDQLIRRHDGDGHATPKTSAPDSDVTRRGVPKSRAPRLAGGPRR